MYTTISQYDAQLLPQSIPEDITDLLLLPRTMDEGRPVFSSSTGPVLKLLRHEGLGVQKLEVGTSVNVTENGLIWLGPVVFIGLSAFTANPNIVAVTLNIISNYVTELFRGQEQEVEVKLDVVTQAGKSFTRVRFVGPPSALKDLADVVESVRQTSSKKD